MPRDAWTLSGDYPLSEDKTLGYPGGSYLTVDLVSSKSTGTLLSICSHSLFLSTMLSTLLTCIYI